MAAPVPAGLQEVREAPHNRTAGRAAAVRERQDRSREREGVALVGMSMVSLPRLGAVIPMQ